MPQPTVSDVHINKPLTNISVAYFNKDQSFIATRVFPEVPVMKKSDVYFTYPKEQWFRTDAKERPPSTESAGSGYEISTDNYSCTRFALHKDVDDEIRANADQPLNPDREATLFVSRQMGLKREKDWGSKFFIASLWTGSSTGGDITPGTKWSAAGSSPIEDIDAQIDAMHQKTGYRPNKLVLPRLVWTKIKNNSDFIDRISVNQTRLVTVELLKTLLELDEVLIADAIENTAAEGKTAVMNWVYGKHALLCYSAPNPSLMEPSAGYTFNWTNFLGAGGQGQRFKKFRMELITSDRVEGEMYYDQKVVATDMGVFFKDVIA
jgi:hypothetical protein